MDMPGISWAKMTKPTQADIFNEPGDFAVGTIADGSLHVFDHKGSQATDLNDYRTCSKVSDQRNLLAFDKHFGHPSLIAQDHAHELIAQSFYFEQPLGQLFKNLAKANDLVDSGVVDGTYAMAEGERRSPSHVRHIVIKETSKDPLADLAKSNYFITDSHIAIRQLQNPDFVLTDADGNVKEPADEIVIYLDDGPLGHHHEITERQKASLRLLHSWTAMRYRKSHLVENLPADVSKAIYDEVRIPNPTESEATPGYNSQPSPWWLKEWFPENNGQNDDTCGKMADVPEKGTVEYDEFVDKLVKVLSVNEGKKESLTRNDNGSGISVGEAQWNQKKGELPNLLQAWLDRDPKYFKDTFGPYCAQMLNADGKTINEKNIRSMNMGGDDDFCNRMQIALNYGPYQGEQDRLVRQKGEKAIAVADQFGHHSQRFVAEVLDVANEKGWGGCEARMRKANVAGIPEEEECTALKKFEEAASDRANASQRDRNLDKMFAPARTAFDLMLWQKAVSKPAESK
jgi:hypothetical protein